MTITLGLSPGLWGHLRSHLLPRGAREEQAAFLFAAALPGPDHLHLQAVDSYMLTAGDFDVQHADYLEVTDDCKSRLIKRAHVQHACLIELHSHPGPWPAAFSAYDLRGLGETVPHMHWRLRGRPYAAIVVANSGFDALVWTGKGEPARALSAIDADGQRLAPTNLTLKAGYGSH